MGNMDNVIAGVLVFVVIAIIIFLVFREVICWYWKINRNVELLIEIRDLLATIAHHIKGNAQGRAVPVVAQSPISVKDAASLQETGPDCIYCGEELSGTVQQCPKCGKRL